MENLSDKLKIEAKTEFARYVDSKLDDKDISLDGEDVSVYYIEDDEDHDFDIKAVFFKRANIIKWLSDEKMQEIETLVKQKIEVLA